MIQGPNVWLFDATGRGVFSNSTCVGGDKTILAPNVSLAPGTHYIAVSYFGLDPQAAAGAIWLPGAPSQRAPDGSGATGTLTGWAGSPNVQPINPYHMNLAFMNYCDAATPTVCGTWETFDLPPVVTRILAHHSRRGVDARAGPWAAAG